MDNQVDKIWDSVAADYDTINFVQRPAGVLIEKAKIVAGQLVLDVACGSGWSTMAAARAVGPTGNITGIDFSKKMLSVASDKAANENLTNIQYRWGNAENLDFDDAIFDTVICASSIFFLQDIPKALCEWRRVVKPGGTVAFTSFGPRFLQPGLEPLGEMLSQFDGLPPAAPSFLERTNSSEKCRKLLEQAHFEEIATIFEQLDLNFSNFENCWKEMTHTFVGGRINQLSSSDLERLKSAYGTEIKTLYSDNNIYIEIPTIFSSAKRPQ